MTQKRIRIDDIRIDGSTQMRESIDDDDIKELAEHYAAGKETPPPVVFWDGTSYWPGDGHHRIAAHRLAGRDSITVEVETGTKRDAILYAAGANSDHGIKRTNGDKRKAVATMLKDKEWMTWSNRAIAKQCNVSDTFVAQIRHQIEGANVCSALENPPNNQAPTRISSDGRTMPASQPSKPLIRCDRCTRHYRSDPARSAPDCPQCAQLRGKPKPLPSNFDDPSDDNKGSCPAPFIPIPPSVHPLKKPVPPVVVVCPNCGVKLPEGAVKIQRIGSFVVPTVAEVAAYCLERKNKVDAEAFVAFYASKGWKVGNQAMKDWKQAIITWEKRPEHQGAHAPDGKPLPNPERAKAISLGWYKPSSGVPYDPAIHNEANYEKARASK